MVGRVVGRCALVMVAATAAVVTGCGRSSPQDDFCHAREGLSCATMATERAAEEAEYAAAVTAGDAALLEARGACVQAFVVEQLEDDCIAPDPNALCSQLCGLHPCGVRAADGTPDQAAQCIPRCLEEATENGIGAAALEASLTRAAGTPGLCTCAICDLASAALCAQLWVCE
jgi:hypothetical protein